MPTNKATACLIVADLKNSPEADPWAAIEALAALIDGFTHAVDSTTEEED
jgi:hypothetical protein